MIYLQTSFRLIPYFVFLSVDILWIVLWTVTDWIKNERMNEWMKRTLLVTLTRKTWNRLGQTCWREAVICYRDERTERPLQAHSNIPSLAESARVTTVIQYKNKLTWVQSWRYDLNVLVCRTEKKWTDEAKTEKNSNSLSQHVEAVYVVAQAGGDEFWLTGGCIV